MDRFTALSIFVRVARAESFSAAAAEMELSRAAVSKYIGWLEKRVGRRLLERTTRRVALTEPGRAFMERCERILADLEEAEASLAENGAAPRGTLRVSAPVCFGNRHVSPAVAIFLGTYPEAGIDLRLNDRLVDMVDEGYDLVIRIADTVNTNAISRRLGPAREVLCASADYLERRGRPEALADLANHDCLIYEGQRPVEAWTFQGSRGPETVSVSGRLSANSYEVLREAALAGHGIVALPTFVIGSDLGSGRLLPVLENYGLAEKGIYALCPSNRQLSPKVRLFTDFLAQRIGPEPAWDGPRATSGPESSGS